MGVRLVACPSFDPSRCRQKLPKEWEEWPLALRVRVLFVL